MSDIAQTIHTLYERVMRDAKTPICDAEMAAVSQVLFDLDSGKRRVAEKRNGEWIVETWLKEAILLFLKFSEKQTTDAGFTKFCDKLPLKFSTITDEALLASGVRIAPPACVRYGAYIAPDTVLMPSYVNVGAFVDTGCMIDIWACVGSCAQIGKHVHLAAGASVGGVLEPLQAAPTIIEDHCFIGAGSQIVEGVIVEAGAVIGMGVQIGQSTRIYHRETGDISYGRIPAGSVVVPGTLPNSDGRYALAAAIIVKQVDAETRKKVGVNGLLRDNG